MNIFLGRHQMTQQIMANTCPTFQVREYHDSLFNRRGVEPSNPYSRERCTGGYVPPIVKAENIWDKQARLEPEHHSSLLSQGVDFLVSGRKPQTGIERETFNLAAIQFGSGKPSSLDVKISPIFPSTLDVKFYPDASKLLVPTLKNRCPLCGK